MSESLKDQLMQLGLAKKKPAAKQRKKPRPKSAAKKTSAANVSLEEAYRLRTRDEKSSKQKARDAKRAADLLRRQINSKVQGIVEQHAQNDKKAELKRNFLYKGRIRSVLVTPEQMKQLNESTLGVVFLRGNYFLVGPSVVEQVRAISADHVPDLSGGEGDDDDEGEHPVPDDLVW